MSDIMNDDGAAIKTARAELPAGDILERLDTSDAGAAKGTNSQVKRAAVKLADKAADLGQTVAAAASTATDQAKEFYARATEQYEAAAARIDPLVRERPYAAIGIAAAAGLLAGLLWAGRSSKVVYLKSPGA